MIDGRFVLSGGAALHHATEGHAAHGPWRSCWELYEATPASNVILLAGVVLALVVLADLSDRIRRQR